MRTAPIAYACDGLRLTGFLADGSGGGPAPGVLVAHEAVGINDHVRERARRLAQRGYVALALDMYGAEGLPREEAIALHIALMTTPDMMRRRAHAALETLLAQPSVDAGRVAALGFCQGGITSLELARDGVPLRAAIGFHPGLKRPAGSADAPILARVLMMVGGSDPEVPPEDRAAFIAEMDAKAVDWQLHVFGGVGHVYTNPDVDALGVPGFAYSPTADARSWSMAMDLLAECFAEQA